MLVRRILVVIVPKRFVWFSFVELCFFDEFAFEVLFSVDFVFAGFIIDPTRVWLFLFVVSVRVFLFGLVLFCVF